MTLRPFFIEIGSIIILALQMAFEAESYFH